LEAGHVDVSGIDAAALMCHQCSQCSGICPSRRNGGINPREIMMRHASGMDDPGDPVLWLCTMCHSCEERCQLEAAPASLIRELRERSTELGMCPKAFSEEAKLFMRTGLSFPNSGLTKKTRKELGLPELITDQKTLEDLGTIVKRSKLGGLRLE
jgi:heterodisulfide reductase subunit C